MMKKYGNITLAEQNDIILSLFGKDMFFALCDKHHKEWNIEYQSSEAFKRKINRLIRGEAGDITMLGYSNNSISDIMLKRIVPNLESESGSELGRYKTAIDSIWCLCKKYILPDMPKDAVLPIRDTDNVYIELFCGLQHIFCPEKSNKELWREAIDELKSCFNSPIACFCKKMEDADKGSADYWRGLVYEMKDGRNPTWAKMCDIIESLGDKNKKLSAKLLEAYFATNFTEVVSRFLGRNFTSSTEKENIRWREASDGIRSVVHEVIDCLSYKGNQAEAKSSIEKIESIAPQACWFYSNWLNGFIEVAKRNYEEASRLYDQAFEHRHFAGDYIKPFLCQAVALALRNDFNINTARKSTDPDGKSKTPLPNDAKRYWNYGWAIGVFEKKADEASIEAYRWQPNFSKYFRHEMFFDPVDENAQTIDRFRVKTELFPSEYEGLRILTEKDINKRRRPSFTDNDVKYHPIAIAIFASATCFRCGMEREGENFLRLVDNWLDNFNGIDLNVVSDYGSAIAADVIQQYGSLRRANRPREITDHLKRIAIQVIRRTDESRLVLCSATKGRNALQEAIKAFDYDLVREIAGKVGIKGIIFPQDDVSPIEYCKKRLNVLRNGLPLPDVTNVDVNKMNLPGLVMKDKEEEFKRLASSEFAPEATAMTFTMEYGVPEVRNRQESELDKILRYLESY